jgi:Domain of unknown function (DUF4386)
MYSSVKHDLRSVDHMATARQARIAGLCYFLVIAGGMFAALFVRDPLFVSGDAAATARSIAASESLWRWGIAVHALYLFAGAAFSVILYRLFKPVHATLALLALVFAIAPVAIEALLLTALYVPLAMIGEGTAFSALDEGQRQALGYLAVRLFLTGWGFSLLLFSGFCTLIGLLILRSRLVPRAIGVLMIAAGASYFLNSLSAILSPALNAALLPGILLPSFVGEFSLAFWLTIRGVKAADLVMP